MITLIISCIFLLLGYIIYSKYIERVFGADANRPTPLKTMEDGVDYVPLSFWKMFLIQFLNIAGLGPIFGAVAGAMWGPVAYLWIILGSVFAGAVHDYFSGMLSIKHNGVSTTEVIGIYLGNATKQFMRGFTVILMLLVGAVFIMGPAAILAGITPDFFSMTFWVWVVLGYFVLATMLPIDIIMGRIYPIFGFALFFMAISLIIGLIVKGYHIPELSLDNFRNFHHEASTFPIFPFLFITIACGAISGFHSIQTPLMARCMTNEKQGRPVFFGTMIVEGIVAMIWATISMSFFGGIQELNSIMNEHQGNAAWVVNEISNSLLGRFGAALALLGVVAAPITSGASAFRSARLIIADFLKIEQKLVNRLLISFPLFAVGYILTRIDFSIIWRYFAWSNQTVATVVLWTITIYLGIHKKNYWVTLIPALFMTAVISTYILIAPEGFRVSQEIGYIAGILLAGALLILFYYRIIRKHN